MTDVTDYVTQLGDFNKKKFKHQVKHTQGQKKEKREIKLFFFFCLKIAITIVEQTGMCGQIDFAYHINQSVVFNVSVPRYSYEKQSKIIRHIQFELRGNNKCT